MATGANSADSTGPQHLESPQLNAALCAASGCAPGRCSFVDWARSSGRLASCRHLRHLAARDHQLLPALRPGSPKTRERSPRAGWAAAQLEREPSHLASDSPESAATCRSPHLPGSTLLQPSPSTRESSLAAGLFRDGDSCLDPTTIHSGHEQDSGCATGTRKLNIELRP